MLRVGVNRSRMHHFNSLISVISLFLQDGTLPLSDEKIIKRIEPNKLSLVMNRRSCVDVDFEKEEPKCPDHPPRADYPR